MSAEVVSSSLTAITNTDNEVVNDGTKYSFQFNKTGVGDGELIGVIKEVNGVKTQVDPTSNEWFQATSSPQALVAYNFQVNEKNEVETQISEASFEELQQYYNDKTRKNDNAETNFNDENDLNIAERYFPPQYAAYRESRGKKVGTDVYTYPLDIDPLQDHLKISKFSYQRPRGSDKVFGAFPARTQDVVIQPGITKDGVVEQEEITAQVNIPGSSMLGNQLKGSVLLPMPKVVDTNGAEWGDSELNIIALASAAVAGKFIPEFEDVKINNELKELTRTMRRNPTKSNFRSFKDSITAAVASEAAIRTTGQTVTADEILARTQGTVLNPNAELLFTGPVLRDFNFDFLMVARSEREGEEIRKIIRWFKTGMAPQFKDATLLKTPNVFTLEYKRGLGDMDVLNTVNRFNPGGLALRTFAVDYAPNGYWSAYQDSQPVALKCSMNFAELRPIYQRDQELTPKNSVGY